MVVDFNNLRVQIAEDYAALIIRLEASGIEHSPGLKRILDGMRIKIHALCCCYQENDPDVRDVSEEIGLLPYFNDEDNG